MVRETEISERRACRLIRMHRWTFRYPGKRREDRSLRERIGELAHRWPRFGYRRLIVLLRREGIEVNHKKAYRVYTDGGSEGSAEAEEDPVQGADGTVAGAEQAQ